MKELKEKPFKVMLSLAGLNKSIPWKLVDVEAALKTPKKDKAYSP